MLVVEDGTGLPNAESYATVDTANDYFSRRGRSGRWAGVAPSADLWAGPWIGAWRGVGAVNQEPWLRLATDYLENSIPWASMRSSATQSLAWPRVGWQGVPREVVAACCELAARAAVGPLLPDEGPQLAFAKVGRISVKYGAPAVFQRFIRDSLRQYQIGARSPTCPR